MSSDISPSEYRSVVGVPDLRPSKEFWNAAREQLGYTEKNGWDKTLWREDGEESLCIREGIHNANCDDLSRQIAVMSNQAKEIHPGIIQFREPHVYYLGRESHVAIVGDKWKPEICKQSPEMDEVLRRVHSPHKPLVYVQRGIGESFLLYSEEGPTQEIER